MSPGFHAFIGVNDALFCCILVFSYSDEIKEEEKAKKEREKKKEPPPEKKWKHRIEFLGIDWHESAQDIDDAIQKVIPTAHIQYYIPEAIKLSPAYGDVTVRLLECPMMRLAYYSLSVERTKANVKVIKGDTLKIIPEVF
jgi:hypothetical protein